MAANPATLDMVLAFARWAASEPEIMAMFTRLGPDDSLSEADRARIAEARCRFVADTGAKISPLVLAAAQPLLRRHAEGRLADPGGAEARAFLAGDPLIERHP